MDGDPYGDSDAFNRSKKQTKIVFLNPTEIDRWDTLQEENSSGPINSDDITKYRKLLCNSISEMTTPSYSYDTPKRRGRPKGSRNKVRKIKDSFKAWLEEESDKEEPILGLEGDIDDDEYFRRLEEERAHEEAEEYRRKRMREVYQPRGRRGRPAKTSYHDYLDPRRALKRKPGLVRKDEIIGDVTKNASLETRKVRWGTALSEGKENTNMLDAILGNSNTVQSDDEEDNDSKNPYEIPLPPSPTSYSKQSLNVPDECPNIPQMSSDISEEIIGDSKILNMDIVKLRRRAPPLLIPQSSNDLNCPAKYVLDILGIYDIFRRYHRILKISPFRVEDFILAMIVQEDSVLLSEVHIVLLKALMKEDDAMHTVYSIGDSKDSVNLPLYLIDHMTYPFLLNLFLTSLKKSESSASAAISASVNQTIASTNPASLLTGCNIAGGADKVLSAAFFPDYSIPLSATYPHVGVQYRIDILRGMCDLFLSTAAIRVEIVRQGLQPHEDHCRICHQSGELLCCDGCTAVFHLSCFDPPMPSVPESTWICPVCEKHATRGVTDCISQEEKAGYAHRQTPIGYDRAGRIYWYIARRLVVEPQDLKQKEPHIPSLLEGVRENWEKDAMRAALDRRSDIYLFLRTHDDDSISNESANSTICSEDDNIGDQVEETKLQHVNCNIYEKKKGKYLHLCDPQRSYCAEPPVYYYSTVDEVKRLREQLSSDWEPLLCHKLDKLISGRLTTEMAITKELEKEGLQEFVDHLSESNTTSDSKIKICSILYCVDGAARLEKEVRLLCILLMSLPLRTQKDD